MSARNLFSSLLALILVSGFLLLLPSAESASCPLTCSSGGTCQFVQQQLDIDYYAGDSVSIAFTNYLCSAVVAAPNLIYESNTPCPSASNVDFSARLQGYIVFPTSENYVFQIYYDNAFRLYINDVVVFSNWFDNQWNTLTSGNYLATANVYTSFKLEMVDDGGAAQWNLKWKKATDSTFVLIPPTAMYQARCVCQPPWGGAQCQLLAGCLGETASNTVFPSSFTGATVAGTCSPGFYSVGPMRTCTATGWGSISNACTANTPGSAVSTCPRACSNGGTCMWKNGVTRDFYSETVATPDPLVNKVTTGTVADINQIWNNNRPDYGVYSDFSAEYTAMLYPPTTGTYTLVIDSDDGARVWVNGVQVLNVWQSGAGSKTSSTFSLTAGVYASLVVDFIDTGSGARIYAYWKLPGSSSQVLIPPANYFLSTCACPAPWTGTTCTVQKGCFADSSGNGVWAATFSENSVIGTCNANFYSSNPQRYCLGNTWNAPTIACTQVYCQVDAQTSGSWPQTNAGVVATISCATGFYSAGTPSRPCTQGTGAIGNWGTITNACQACSCGAGSNSSACDSTGKCTCNPGFTGLKCDQCVAGNYGTLCQTCPNCQNGTCFSGITGNGSCTCIDGWAKSASVGCDICLPGRFGNTCSGNCPTCNHGTCSDGLLGTGLCTCEVGWIDNGGSKCSQCQNGYALVSGNCEPCHPSCVTCSGSLDTQCLTCPPSFNYNANHSCTSSCGDHFYSNSSICTPCYATCETCLTGQSNGCTSCTIDTVLDVGSCLPSCQTSQTFDNNGICTPCSPRCQTCQGTTATDCLTCTPGFVLDVDNSCVATCAQPNYYVASSVCQPCHGNCSTCTGPGANQCLTCPLSKSLDNGTCVETCPDGKFNDNRVCHVCSSTCKTCDGPSFSNCLSCDEESYLKYFDQGLCNNRCGIFRYAPEGTFLCQSCDCNGHSTSCDDFGVCQSCNDNTEGSACESCIAKTFRTENDLYLGCEECSCNGLSATCDSVTGNCTSCEGNTHGDDCGQCNDGFVQLVPEVGCSIVNCAGESIDGMTWPFTLIGTEAVGTCNTGYTSDISPTRNCTNSGITPVWSPVIVNACAKITCRAVNESGVLWPVTAAGTTVTGKCPIDMVSASKPSRTCLLQGNVGVWGSITDKCEIPETAEDNFNKIGVPILATVLVVLGLAALGLALYVYLGRKRKEKLKMVEMLHYGSGTQLADFEAFGGGPNVSVTQHSRASKASGNTTMINTIIDGQISLPGFLVMDHANDIRAEKVIASGGAGQISFGVIVNADLRAKYPQYADSIAIKTVATPPGVPEAHALASFHQEVAILNTLSYHPNIIKLLGYTETPNCIITPLYKGDLNSLIHVKAKHSYTSLEAMDMVAQMVAAIDAVHSIMAAHRDIKPSNFLLEPRTARPGMGFGEWSSFPYRVRLCDFGICYIDSDQAKPILQVYNQFGFSARYAAPEVFSKLSLPSSHSGLLEFQMADMYSLGVSVWEVIHREVPWPTETFEEIRERVVNEERPRVTMDSSSDSKIQFLVQLLGIVWNQSPMNRPNFRNLVNQIRDFMSNEPTPYTETRLE